MSERSNRSNDQENTSERVSGREEGYDSAEETEYEEIDLTENPLYQVLSAFFENEEGENLCDHFAKLTLAIEKNTKAMEKLLSKK